MKEIRKPQLGGFYVTEVPNAVRFSMFNKNDVLWNYGNNLQSIFTIVNYW